MPAALTVLLLSGRGSNLPHWTAYLWWVLTPVAAWGALNMAQRRPALMKALMAFQALCVALMVGLLLWGGQKVMRVWLRIVDRRNSEELFMLNILLITLGLAWLPSMPVCPWPWVRSWPVC